MSNNLYIHASDAGNFHYFTGLVKKADDLKFLLGRILYELSDISYKQGSRKSDFDIRDSVKELSGEIAKYMGYIRLLENAKQGHLDAYEDILVYFQNNFIDYCSVDEKLEKLNASIVSQMSLDKKHNETSPEPSQARRSNLFIDDLKKSVASFERTFHSTVSINLTEFLNVTNELYFIDSLKLMSERSAANQFNHEENKNQFCRLCHTYLWEKFRIECRLRPKSEMSEILGSMIERSGYDEMIKEKLCIGSGEYDKLLSSVAGDIFQNIQSLDIFKETVCSEKNIQTCIAGKNQSEIEKDIRALIDDMGKQTIFLSPYVSGVEVVPPQSERKRHYAVYDIIGSYEVYLKTVIFYLVDSLFFVYTWVLTVLNNSSLARKVLNPFLENISLCVGFMDLVERAQKEVCLKKTVFTANTILQIPVDTAGELRDAVRTVVQVIEQSFVESVVTLEFINTKSSATLLKKITIVKESFSNSKNRILEHL